MGTYRHAMPSFEESHRQRTPSYRERLARYRKGHAVQKIERPSNPLRARTLGYKAKKAYTVVVVQIKRGKRSRRKADLGRKPAKNRKFVNPGRSLQFYAEDKAKRRYSNMDVVNSYLAGQDGESKYFEVILRDPRLL